ncbi:DUF2891 domain-containing protein [Salinisphaera sp. SPP-AMP-43]|uniref:DUF2891 domain-containing protein n=1 Tax=Salinisphaera sp. SPP-AMP-43 TaxID=3121288 RepID=UPI003C6E7156
MPLLETATADRLAAIALSHVEREFPNHITHRLNSPADVGTPAELHPIFFGSFDWHSCVHSYWLLARLAADGDLSPSRVTAIRDLFARRIRPEAVAAEVRYFEAPGRASFERPYGWAWFVKLAAELDQHPDRELRRAGDTLAPLCQIIVELWQEFWPKQTYPIRAGVHSNSAFATVLGLDYGTATSNEALAVVLREQAARWYGRDQGQPAWEPSGDEFLSPALVEALAMQRVLEADAFARWFDSYFPALAQRQPATLFTPAIVSDQSDGKLAHLNGLNLSRAWCWHTLAATLPEDDPRVALMHETADQHLAAGLTDLETDYMGSHWLASFARLALGAAAG